MKKFANRKCCNVEIRDYFSNMQSMFINFCNVTTCNFSSDSLYATVNGGKFINYNSPIDGTLELTFQVYPFQIYTLLNGGNLLNDGIIARHEELIALENGKLKLSYKPVAGSVFVYSGNNFIENLIEGVSYENVFASENIKKGDVYSVGYLEKKEKGVKRILFNNNDNLHTYSIRMITMDKSEDGDETAIQLIANKCVPNRELSIEFSSSDSPAEITISFECFADGNNNAIDFVEIDDTMLDDIWINFDDNTLETTSSSFFVENGYLFEIKEGY